MLHTGLQAESKVVVSHENTALKLGSGDMEVFATPAMVALMENAAMRAVQSELAEGDTTVGTAMQTSHIKASKLGAQITASAELTEIDGRALHFHVKAWDEVGIIGEGKHTRFIVTKERFLAKL